MDGCGCHGLPGGLRWHSLTNEEAKVSAETVRSTMALQHFVSKVLHQPNDLLLRCLQMDTKKQAHCTVHKSRRQKSEMLKPRNFVLIQWPVRNRTCVLWQSKYKQAKNALMVKAVLEVWQMHTSWAGYSLGQRKGRSHVTC